MMANLNIEQLFFSLHRRIAEILSKPQDPPRGFSLYTSLCKLKTRDKVISSRSSLWGFFTLITFQSESIIRYIFVMN